MARQLASDEIWDREWGKWETGTWKDDIEFKQWCKTMEWWWSINREVGTYQWAIKLLDDPDVGWAMWLCLINWKSIMTAWLLSWWIQIKCPFFYFLFIYHIVMFHLLAARINRLLVDFTGRSIHVCTLYKLFSRLLTNCIDDNRVMELLCIS